MEGRTRNPSLKESDPLTLSTVWYRLRPKFIDNNIVIKKRTRGMIEYQYIRDIIKDEMHLKRADLGIQTAVRAQLYYRGEAFDISLDNIGELVKKGTDIIPMEKEGIAAVLAPFAYGRGIAILNSRGFFTENADEFLGVVNDELGGNNIAVLHDFDSAGVAISKKAPKSQRKNLTVL